MIAQRVCIVVPCYNESERFKSSAFTRALATSSETTFVLINDGSTDATLSILRALEAAHPNSVEVVDHGENLGKGQAVRTGMRIAFERGAELAGYWDADLATPLEAIADFVHVMDADAEIDLLFGARVAMLGRTIERSPLRHYAGRVFATLASLTLGLPVYDTQCGAKLFRVNDRTQGLFADPFDSRWVFDVEILARYLDAGGAFEGIRELPLEHWTDVEGSKVRPTDFARAVVELGRIKRKYRPKP